MSVTGTVVSRLNVEISLKGSVLLLHAIDRSTKIETAATLFTF